MSILGSVTGASAPPLPYHGRGATVLESCGVIAEISGTQFCLELMCQARYLPPWRGAHVASEHLVPSSDVRLSACTLSLRLSADLMHIFNVHKISAISHDLSIAAHRCG